MERRKDFGMLDETDVQIVVKDKQTPAWTGSWSELPPAELFEQVKKVLLVIYASPDLSSEELNSTLDDVHNRLPDDALFLYTIVSNKTENTTSTKRMELYVNKN